MTTNGMQHNYSRANAGNMSQISLAATNIKIINWAPQNDVLGDPAVKVFVTHAGSNSINEAAYHGKPIVCIPLLADQFDQAAKVTRKITVHCMCVCAGVRSVCKSATLHKQASVLGKCRLHRAQSVQGAVITWKVMLQCVMLAYSTCQVLLSPSCALQHHMSALDRTPDCIFAAGCRNAKNVHKHPHVIKDGTTALFMGTSAAAFELNERCLCRQGIMGCCSS